MKTKERNKILETGVLAAELLASGGYSGVLYENFCSYLFNGLRSFLEQIQFYLLDKNQNVLKEEVVCSRNGAFQGQDLMPLYQLPGETEKLGKVVEIHDKKSYRLFIPLNFEDKLLGLLILTGNCPLTEHIACFETMGKSIAMCLFQTISSQVDTRIISFFNKTLDIANSLNVANSVEQLVIHFARQAVTHLKFERITVFINSYESQEQAFNYCITSWGREIEIKRNSDLPHGIKEPLPVHHRTGYWFPLLTNMREVGLVLFDNLYSLYPIPENYLHLLTPLCNQLATTLENIHLFQDIQRAAQRDKLTDLYNRAYFEMQIALLDREENYPLSFIIGDINGLKITNDIFGHFEGDVILKEIAATFKGVCRKEDIIARWGGDEYVVLLPKTDEKRAEALIQSIKQKCIADKNTKIQLSISLGCATKKNAQEDMSIIMKKAEDRMYRNKLLERTYFRNTFIAKMRELMHFQCQEPEEHIDRMDHLSGLLGKQMNLSENELEELKLLAMLHDIGKVAIRQDVLTKPGKLTKEEWVEIKKHSEAGYRIAQASPELSSLAGFILSHHERWDGKGYPMGKKGCEIPLLSRIITVIDAYDVMTHGRVYKTVMTHEEAVAELKRCAGTQFDPEVVDKFLKIKDDELILVDEASH